MPERVTTRRVGSPSAESTRFPGEGQSAQGQSGPKARPKGVADGQAVNIPPPAGEVESSGDAGQSRVGALETPVPQGRQLVWKPDDVPATKSRTRTNRAARTAIRHRCARRVSEGVRENPREGTRQNDPVPSVQGVLPRKGEPQRIGSSDCLSKTQDSANSQEDV